MLKLYIVTYLQEEWCVEVIYMLLTCRRSGVLKSYIDTYLQEEWYVEVIYSYLLEGGVVC